jgi:hypothetical protein
MNDRSMIRERLLNVATGCLALFAMPAAGWAAAPEVKSVDWSPHAAQSGCHMNMGPTGARAWMRGFLFEVVSVDAGSPASGILQPGDQVLSAGREKFTAKTDARMILGNAIGRAEAKDGRLDLVIQRDGRKQNVKVTLPVTGPYAPTWPHGCVKSQRILEEACQYLRGMQLPNGMVVTDGNFGSFNAGLLLLASGDARFRDSARRAVYSTADMNLIGLDYHNWAIGYGGILLAEYYLATGDGSVLPRLKEICDHVATGQMQCGSWGHNCPSGGYGAMNQPALACAIMMVLARECGVEVDRAAFQRTVAFFSRYAELGAVPYGDHQPSIGAPDDNGKSAAAAILCSLLPERQAAATVFSQSVAMSYWLREEGHTGGFFSMIWGPLGADLAGADAFRPFMDYQGWYYNLCRTWRGALVMLPFHEALTRFDSSSYVDAGGEFTTGGMGLAFALPHRQLRILGAPRSVFAAGLEGPLLKARQSYQARQWAAFEADLAAARPALRSTVEKRFLAQLEAAAAMARADARCTVREIENNIQEEDFHRAEQQYLALKRFLGEQDETIQVLAKHFSADALPGYIKNAGVDYYKNWGGVRGIAVMSWVPYGDRAKALLGADPSLRLPVWESLVPVSSTSTPPWQAKAGTGVVGNISFRVESTDYTQLGVRLQSPRQSETMIQLNGVEVAHVVRGQRSGYARIGLERTAVSLLKKGENQLVVTSTSVGSGGNALSVGLEGVRNELSLAPSPLAMRDETGVKPLPAILRNTLEKARRSAPGMSTAETADLAIPERLRVRDSEDQFRTALSAACDAMSPEELGVALRSPVAYWRYLASQSLSRRGEAGLAIATEGLKDADWHVRSACCDVFTFKAVPVKKGMPPVRTKVDGAVMAGLTALVHDDNAWVRCRAASALGALSNLDADAAAALAKASVDSDPWVRVNAIGAIGKVTEERGLLLKAAVGAMGMQDTTFSVVDRALALIRKYGSDDPSIIPSLIFALEHPGEGDGQQLNEIMVLLGKLDPGGLVTVPMLTKVAAGGYSYNRLKGSPRKTAIELLGQRGAAANSAVPVLKAIVDAEKEHSLKNVANTALEQIQKEIKP